jgi:hypothetical protein
VGAAVIDRKPCPLCGQTFTPQALGPHYLRCLDLQRHVGDTRPAHTTPKRPWALTDYDRRLLQQLRIRSDE